MELVYKGQFNPQNPRCFGWGSDSPLWQRLWYTAWVGRVSSLWEPYSWPRKPWKTKLNMPRSTVLDRAL